MDIRGIESSEDTHFIYPPVDSPSTLAGMSSAKDTCWLLQMPSALVISILSNWLSSMKDLCHLDSACCCHDYRAVLLYILKCDEFVADNEVDEVFAVDSYLRWLASRCVRVQHFAVAAHTTMVKLDSVSVAAPYLQRLQSLYISDQLLLRFAPHLPQLQVLQDLEVTAATAGDGGSVNSEALLRCFARLGSSVRRVALRKLPYASDAVLAVLGMRCGQLHQLLLEACPTVLFHICGFAGSTALSAFAKASAAIAAAAAAAATTDDRAGNSKLTDSAAEMFPRLRQLSLDSCRSITPAALFYWIRQIGPQLQQLNIDRMLPQRADIELAETDTTLICRGISGSCVGLEALSAADSVGLTDAMMQEVLQSCGSIRSLGLSNCSGLLDCSGWLPQLQDLRQLRIDEVQCISDGDMQLLAQRCPRLVSLSACHCNGISDLTLEALADHCSRLQELRLGGCSGVGDAGVVAVASRCGALRQLVLYRSNQQHEQHEQQKQLTDVALTAVAGGCPYMQHLNISYAACISDASLQALAAGCRRLQVLVAIRCVSLTDEGLGRLAAACAELRQLDLSHCSRIRDRGLLALAAHSRQLAMLDISGCDAVTGDGLEVVLRSCPQLRSLIASHCEGLTDHRVMQLLHKYPRRILFEE